MTLPISVDIESEVNAASTAVVDLFTVDFGGNYRYYWSTHQVPDDWFPGMEFEGVHPSDFDARVLIEGVGSRRWSLGFSNDSMDLVLGDADGFVTAIAREIGITRFQGAKVRNWQLFPNVKEAFKIWEGQGKAPTFRTHEVTWPISFGFSNLKRRFGRRFGFNCLNLYGGGEASDCPADPLKARGLPNVLAGIGYFEASAGTSNSAINYSGGGFSGFVQIGWIAYDKTNNCYARVTGITNDTTVAIADVIAGEGGVATFAAGHEIVIAPKAASCVKTPDACRMLGMWGPSDSGSTGAGDKRRYYTGNNAAPNVTFTGRLPKDKGGTRFTRRSMGNETYDGRIIPVVFGFYRISGIEAMHWIGAEPFQHGYFEVCEGEIVDIAGLLMAGKPIDGGDPRGGAGVSETDKIIQHDAFIKWGTWSPNGVEDNLIVDLPSLRRVRRAVGRRASIHYRAGDKRIDTYGTGTMGNPAFINSAMGDGLSISGKVCIRWRVETDTDVTNAPTGDFDLIGLLVPLPVGHPWFTTLGAPGHGKTIGDVYYPYAMAPNPILVSYAICTDPRWGASTPTSYIDLQSVVNESVYCEEVIGSVAGNSEINGLITAEAQYFTPPEERGGYLFWTDSISDKDGSLYGRQIIFTYPDGYEHITTINRTRTFRYPSSEEMGSGTSYEFPYPNDTGTLVMVRDAWPDGRGPDLYLPFRITDVLQMSRFKANGALADNIPVGEMLQRVLDNCNGTYRQGFNGQIEFLIRKQLAREELDDIATDFLFTDRGIHRNILANADGTTTLTCWQEDDESIANMYTASFVDSARDFQDSVVAVYSEEAQTKAASLHGDEGSRHVTSEDVMLNMTTSVGQAARLLALRARENYIQNFHCQFQTSLKKGYAVQPGDIIAIDSLKFDIFDTADIDPEIISDEGALFFRVLTKELYTNYTIKFTCQVHINSIYDDYATTFGEFFYRDNVTRPKGAMPAYVLPSDPTSRIVVDEGGSLREFIDIEVTWPDA